MRILLIPFILSSTMVHAIDHGVNVDSGKFISVVKIANSRNGGHVHCTGTLMTPQIVITAAHCVDKNYFKEQHVSYADDPTGNLFPLLKKKLRVKNVFYHDDYPVSKINLEMLDDHIKSDFFKKSSLQDQQQTLYKRHQLSMRVNNLDMAFIELEHAQIVGQDRLPGLSCEKLSLMSRVTMVGYGQNIKKPQGENSNFGYVLQQGHNWYTSGETYQFSQSSGNLINNGDSGGPLFKENDSKVFGVASTKVINKNEINQKSSYASTASDEAKSFYWLLNRNPKAPEELKNLIKPCLNH